MCKIIVCSGSFVTSVDIDKKIEHTLAALVRCRPITHPCSVLSSYLHLHALSMSVGVSCDACAENDCPNSEYTFSDDSLLAVLLRELAHVERI